MRTSAHTAFLNEYVPNLQSWAGTGSARVFGTFGFDNEAQVVHFDTTTARST